MAKLCLIAGCNAKNDLFCVPDEDRKLRKWSNIVKQPINKTDLICALHFENKYIGTEKFLVQNAIPTILLNAGAEQEIDNKCNSCFEIFDIFNPKHPEGSQDNIRKLFATGTGGLKVSS
jgi:hypothetical protein